jgi:hypothetical protein
MCDIKNQQTLVDKKYHVSSRQVDTQQTPGKQQITAYLILKHPTYVYVPLLTAARSAFRTVQQKRQVNDRYE